VEENSNSGNSHKEESKKIFQVINQEDKADDSRDEKKIVHFFPPFKNNI